MTDSEFAVMRDKLMSIGIEAGIGEATVRLHELGNDEGAVMLAKNRRIVCDRAMAMCKAAFIVEKARGEKDA